MPETKLKTQRVLLADGTVKEIQVKSISAEALAQAEERKAQQRAKKKAAIKNPPQT